MKFLLIAFALVGIAAAATLPDSATQGPNPQDIATPEPEYIDIDLPEAAPAPKPAPAPKSFAPAPRPIQRPIQAASFSAPIVHQQFQPQLLQPQLPGHFHGQSGYQYRRPVYVRRVYRRRY
ncbi:protein TonB [Calliphora vicina]|uniref:protein TonB n=1 Tax=Calliphora vicina TaxID=7373 RepID=UPI00325A56F9